MERRYEEVCAFCATAAIAGYNVYSPIAHWHPIAKKHLLPKDESWWKEANEDILKRCDQLWILRLDGWLQSDGILREVKFAKLNGIRVLKKGGKGNV